MHAQSAAAALPRSVSDGVEIAVGPDPASAYTLPARFYTDPAIAKAEGPAIWYRSWNYACHGSRLARPGDYVVIRVFEEDILVIRGRDERIRAFYHVCRHRAHQLLAGEGNVSTVIRCPYHAWCYDLDGTLRGVPGLDKAKDFDRASFRLKEVQVGEIAGFLFVNLDPAALSIEETYPGLDAEIRRMCPYVDDIRYLTSLSYEIGGNWKATFDNFIECYHCPAAHPGFCDIMDMSSFELTLSRWHQRQYARSRTNDSREAYRYSRETNHQPLDWFAAWVLWPNFSFEVFPGEPNFNTSIKVPTGPETSRWSFEMYFLTDGMTPERQHYLDYFDRLTREDVALIDSVQKGLRSRSYSQGRFMVDPADAAKGEAGVHMFHRLVQEAMAGVGG